MNEKIKAICFDLDNTLLDRNKGADLAFREMVTKFSDLKRGTTEYEAMVHSIINWDEFGNSDKAYLVNNMVSNGINITLEQMKKWWFDNLGLYEKPFEDTYEVLDYLRQNYKLAIVTNGSSIGQRTKIAENNLSEYFDVIVISDEVGCAKPDCKIYEIACQRLGLLAEEVAFVGDTYPTDIIGAYRSGMVPVWMWTIIDGRQNEDGITRIHSLSELKNIF